jgi:hypothetical protein
VAICAVDIRESPIYAGFINGARLQLLGDSERETEGYNPQHVVTTVYFVNEEGPKNEY